MWREGSLMSGGLSKTYRSIGPERLKAELQRFWLADGSLRHLFQVYIVDACHVALRGFGIADQPGKLIERRDFDRAGA